MRAPPRSFSQLATSFLAGLRLGIPRALLLRLAISPTLLKISLTSQPKALAPSLSALSDTHTVKQPDGTWFVPSDGT